MAISTYKTFLMKGTAGSGSTVTWSKVCDIKDFPDLGGAPEMIEITTLSDAAQRFIPGIQQLDAMEFTANYDSTEYTTIKGYVGTEGDYAVWFGATVTGATVTPTGSEGKFKFKGYPDVYIVGAGTNEAVDMKIVIACSSAIVKDTST